MRLVNWNIEWMNRWIGGNRDPVWGTRSLAPDAAKRVAGRVARVVAALRPDLLTIQEGPSAMAEMRLFVDDVLAPVTGRDWEILLGRAGGQQKLYALRAADGLVRAMEPAEDAPTLALDEPWGADVNGDMRLEGYEFTRLPFVVDVDPVGQAPLRVVILHTKSKYVHMGQELYADPARRQDFVVQALQARRRISAEGFRLRTYLDTLIAADRSARIVVTGDWNDGPGRDMFERFYLTHNVADIVLGSTFYPDLIFHHPLLADVPTPALFTARFDDFVDGVMDRPLLLDHFAVSPTLRDEVRGDIAHDAFEAEVEGPGARREDRPSDHRPIVLDLFGS